MGLTRKGLKAMEELAKLEAQQGNPEYLEAEYGEGDVRGDGNVHGGRNVHGDRDARRQGDTRERTYAHPAAAGRRLRGSGVGEGFRQQESAGRGSQGKGAGRRASNEMCIFLILNISSLQLIPVNMIAYRAQYGSANPAGIIVPAIAATLVSTLVAIAYCKIKDRACIGYRGRSSADLTASEAYGISASGAGLRRVGMPAGMLSGKRNGRGGKAV